MDIWGCIRMYRGAGQKIEATMQLRVSELNTPYSQYVPKIIQGIRVSCQACAFIEVHWALSVYCYTPGIRFSWFARYCIFSTYPYSKVPLT